jgi:arylsulfatase A-like enzyme
MSHRLPNYHLELQKAGYETAHIGKWHMGNDGMPRPGYDTWVSYDGHGKIENPTLNHDGKYVEHRGYITDIMNELAVEFLERKRSKPFSLFFAHKAVHPDAKQARTARSESPTTAATSPRRAIGSLSRCDFPQDAEHAVAGRSGEAEARVGGRLRTQAIGAGAPDSLCTPRGRAGGDPAARADDGIGR